jgi:ribonuclease R
MKKKFTKRDPDYQKEKKKYPNPIASRKFILKILEEASSPLSRKAIETILNLQKDSDKKALQARLRAMTRDGQVIRNRRDLYALVAKTDLKQGTIIGHRDGYGFLSLVDLEEDVFISPIQMQKLLHDDIVLAHVTKASSSHKYQAIITEVIKHQLTSITGKVLIEQENYLLKPCNKHIHHPILLNKNPKLKIKNGDYVVATILHYPNKYRQVTAEIHEVLKENSLTSLENHVAIRSHNIPFEWPNSVSSQAKNMPILPIKSKSKREDWRKLHFVTIDGEDAKDFDDAVYVEDLGSKGSKIYVAIADVSSYIPEHSPLDKEAKLRATSVYLPKVVIPMLPERLSNDLCSLRPQEDRLTLGVTLNIDTQGKLCSYQFTPSIIHSKARLTYTEISAMLNHKTPTPTTFQQPLQALYKAYKSLEIARNLRGAIEFDTIEPQIIFNKVGKIEDIVARERNVAHKIIEECMLLANTAAADLLIEHKFPALFRVHARPNADKLAEANFMLKNFGYQLPDVKRLQPQDYNRILKTSSKKTEGDIIQILLLRSMQQAVYQPKNVGHFGLNYSRYTHFTSPIRRYPDLIVHRAIYSILEKEQPQNFSELIALGKHCSESERRADEASRDAIRWLKCEFMQDKSDKIFDAHVTSIVQYGLFVKLDELLVEGLIHISELGNDYYQYEPQQICIKGKKFKKVYKIGDSCRVKIINIDMEEHKIDFTMLDN